MDDWEMSTPPKVKCATCESFRQEGISERCYHSKNITKTWRGLCFFKSPSNRNWNKQCDLYSQKQE